METVVPVIPVWAPSGHDKLTIGAGLQGRWPRRGCGSDGPRMNTPWCGTPRLRLRPAPRVMKAGATGTMRAGGPTVHGGLARQDDHHQLQASVRVLQMPEHGLHAICPLGIFAEARLALDGHSGVPRDLSELLREGPEGEGSVDVNARQVPQAPHQPEAPRKGPASTAQPQTLYVDVRVQV